MGYRRKNYRLKWPDGHELAGLEVLLRGMKIGELGQLAGLRGVSAENMEQGLLDEIAELFARHLIEWNYEDESGIPIPATLAGIGEMDVRALMQVVTRWAEVAADVPAPLAASSNSGGPYPVASIPMEVP